MLFTKINSAPEFNFSQLAGNWERNMDARPENPIMRDEYYQKELLKISSDTILRFDGHIKDTINWQFNREQNSIILNCNYKLKDRLGHHWNIVEVENNVLVLERRIISATNNEATIHQFNKVN